MTNRDEYIDFLRSFGLCLVILAHVNAPLMITQIRCFDVPLMLFVSGLSYSGRRIPIAKMNFYWLRTKRIIIPVYCFLFLYLVLLWLLDNKLTISFVVGSFTLSYSYGVQFVWIMRVFLLVMLMTPFLIKMEKGISGVKLAFFLVLMIVILECLTNIKSLLGLGLFANIYEETILWLFAYSIPFVLGLRIRFACKKEVYSYLSFFSVIAVVYFVHYILTKGFPIVISPNYKYPPHSYYVVYGLWCASILWSLKSKFEILVKNKAILFIGKNTIWIYLWHIMALLAMSNLTDLWYVKYIGTIVVSISIVYLQVGLIQFIQRKYPSQMWKYFIG